MVGEENLGVVLEFGRGETLFSFSFFPEQKEENFFLSFALQLRPDYNTTQKKEKQASLKLLAGKREMMAFSSEVEVRKILEQLPVWEGPVPEVALPLDPETRVGTLENGMVYYVRSNAEPRDRVECSVVVRAGSIDEAESERGLAHVLEHLAFRARKGEAGSWGTVRELESKGVKFGSHSNAWTSFEETAYWLHVPADFSKRAMELLAALVFEIRASSADVDAERKIVVEEWRQTKDWSQRASEAHFAHSFRGTKLAERLPIGTLRVLQNATAEDVRGFYERHYRPERMAVIIVGDLQEDIVPFLEKTFGGFRRQSAVTHEWPRRKEAFFLLEGEEDDDVSEASKSLFFGAEALGLEEDFSGKIHNVDRISIHDDLEASATTVAVSCAKKWSAPTTFAKFRDWILDDLFHLLMNRRLEKLALLPRPPFANASTSTERPIAYVRGGSALSISTLAVDPTRRDACPEALKAAWAEIERAAQGGFSESELAIGKVELLSDVRSQWLERSQTESSAFGEELRDNFLLGMPVLGPKVEASLTALILKDLHDSHEVSKRAYDLFQLEKGWRNRVVAVTRPTKKTKTFFFPKWFKDDEPTDDRLLFVDAIEKGHLLAAKNASESTGPSDEEKRAFFEPLTESSEDKSRGEKLTKRLLYQSSEVDGAPKEATELELSNGVVVTFARTQLRNDEIVLKAVARGGLSELLSVPEDRRRVLMAGKACCALAAEYGIFGVTKTHLMDMLGGRRLGVTPSVDAYRRTLSGDCAPDDFEAMLCLVHRAFASSLTRDDARLETFKDLCRENLSHEQKDPQARFSACFDSITTKDHFFFQRATLEDLDAFDADYSASLYDAAFSTGPWKIALVGALPPDDVLISLCEKWIGSLTFTTPDLSSKQKNLFLRFDNRGKPKKRTPLDVKFPMAVVEKEVTFIPTDFVVAAAGKRETSPHAQHLSGDGLNAAVTKVALPTIAGGGKNQGDPAIARLRDTLALDVAAALLEARLVDVLRMDAGKVYDASARVSFAAANPLDDDDDDSSPLEGVLVLSASHDPEDRAFIVDSCLDQVEKLRRGDLDTIGAGPSVRELDNVLNAMHNDRTENLRRNAYWANAIVRSYSSPRFDGDLAHTYEQTVRTRDAITDELRNSPNRLQSLQRSFDQALHFSPAGTQNIISPESPSSSSSSSSSSSRTTTTKNLSSTNDAAPPPPPRHKKAGGGPRAVVSLLPSSTRKRRLPMALMAASVAATAAAALAIVSRRRGGGLY